MFDNILKTEEDTAYSTAQTEPNIDSERMEAGYNALFEKGGEEGLETFWKVRNERTDLGYSPTSEGLKTNLHQEETDMLNLGIQNALLDPAVDMETKRAFASMSVEDDRPETPLPTKLGRELLMADDDASGIPATDEQDELRSMFIDNLQRVTEYRAMQQAVMDDRNFAKTETGLSMAFDLATMVVPFVEQANVAEALSKVGKGDMSLGAFFMQGNYKKAFFDSFKNMPIETRKEILPLYAKIAQEANTTAFVTNGLLEQQMLQELVYGGNYSDVDKWVDNLVSWADLSVVAKPAAWAARSVQKLVKGGKAVKQIKAVEEAAKTQKLAEQLLSDMKIDMTRTTVSPVSPIRVASETNAESAKTMFNAVVLDTTEEAAGAFGGASKVEVVADSLLPEFHKASGVRSKVHNIESKYDSSVLISPEIKTALDESYVNALTRSELESAAANEVSNLQDVVGVVSRNEMFQHEVTPFGAKIHGVYGNTKTGWANADEALDQTEMALKAHGVDRSDLYIMERSKDTGEYFRVAEPTGNDFLVGFDYDYSVNFSDVMKWDELSVTKNFLDRIPLLAKNYVNRNFFDPANIVDPHLFLGANARVDRSAKITQDFLAVGKKFSEGFSKASKDSQSSMYKYILEANEKQIPHNINTLKGEYGFSADEIKTLNNFREYWDTVWTARNVTDIRELRNRGFGLFENAKGDRIFSRPIVKGQINRSEKIYDPATGISEFVDEATLVKLYDGGHTVVKLRRPQQLGGTITDQMIVKNNGEWRALKDSDKVYPYRHGYFQRMYTSPHFIVKKGVTSGGVEFERAIATAESEVDATIYLKGLKSKDKLGEYYVRTDVKDPRAQGAYEMDTFESHGLSMQRERGDKLIDATAVVRGTEDANVLGPVDAIIASSRSMGRKVAMGDFIEAAKQRFMKQFEAQLPKERGMTQYPRRMEDIGAKGMSHSAEAADARSTYEYISFLEYGYINGMDSVFKSALKSLASKAAGLGMRKTEAALAKIGDIAPTSLAKNVAFQMYIASNPVRQAALNAHQSTLLTAKFPQYVLSQRLAADIHAFVYKRMGVKVPKLAVKATGRTEAELDFMWKEYQKSGLSASIDQNNMIRGSLVDMVESQRFKQDQGILGGTLSLARRAGFDLGEEINLNTSWLAHYDEAVRKNKFLNASDLDRIAGNARNFTFNMNRAGDMPYNSQALSVLFQFMQVPHKSLLQMSNRALTGAERTSLGMYNLLMFSLPPAAMYDWFAGTLPDRDKHPEAHEAIVSGLQFYTFNKLIELSTGEDVSMDFGNLAPSDAYGLYAFMRNALTTEIGDMLANTPSGQAFAGGNPRITKFFKTLGRFVYPRDTDNMTPTTLSNVFTDLAAISSGMSNIFKAKMALEYHKSFGNRGQVTDPSVSTPEAMLMAFGFKTMEEAQRTWVGMDVYKQSTKYTKDVNEWYKQFTMKLASEGGLASTDEYIVDTLVMAHKAFGNDTKAMNIIKKNLDRDSQSGTGTIYDTILRMADYTPVSKMEEWSNTVPDDGSGSKQALEETIKYIREYKEQE